MLTPPGCIPPEYFPSGLLGICELCLLCRRCYRMLPGSMVESLTGSVDNGSLAEVSRAVLSSRRPQRSSAMGRLLVQATLCMIFQNEGRYIFGMSNFGENWEFRGRKRTGSRRQKSAGGPGLGRSVEQVNTAGNLKFTSLCRRQESFDDNEDAGLHQRETAER
jgi:hypothetical protein